MRTTKIENNINMPRKILILDTSILCCWLKVPGKEEAGPLDDRWNHERVNALLQVEKEAGSIFVLPIAALIETGNHIAQASDHRHERAKSLSDCLRAAADGASPWAAFTDQSELWNSSNLLLLAENWPALAAKKITIGDATIKDVAEQYAKGPFDVEILTGDAGLKSYQPVSKPRVPRRRGGSRN